MPAAQELVLGPIATAAGVVLAVFVFARLLRWAIKLFVTVYILIGVATYLYWIYVEAAPPHGNYIARFDSLNDIVWQVIVALASILGWPFWPIIRTAVLDI